MTTAGMGVVCVCGVAAVHLPTGGECWLAAKVVTGQKDNDNKMRRFMNAGVQVWKA